MNKIVEQIGQMNFQGNIVPMSWFEHIKTEAGKPDSIGILILSDIVYWYRPTIVRDEATGKILKYEKKFKADKLQKSYEQIAEQFGYSKTQVRRALRRLEAQGLITLEFRNITTSGGLKLTNVLYIEPVPAKIAEITYISMLSEQTEKHTRKYTPPDKFVNTSRQKCQDPLDKKVETYTENTTEITTETTTLNTYALESACDSTRASPNDHDKQEKPRKPFRSLKQQQRFDAFWEAYPRKRSKGQAEKTWVKINPDDDLLEEILAGLENAKRSVDWQKDGGQYIPYPSTWLNAKGWEDEYEEAMSNGKTGRSFGKADGEGKKPKSNWGRFAGLIPIRDGGTGEDIGSQDNEDTAANSEAPGSPK